MSPKSLADQVDEAYDRIRSYILKTPLIRSMTLSEAIKGNVYLKLENEQYTGSFKLRGSLNKMLCLSQEEKLKSIITASTGNHGLGFAKAIQLTGAKGTVYLPKSASKAKIKKLSNYPVSLEFIDGDSLSTELKAKSTANEMGAIWISPYNDYEVMAGQGTIGLELLDQLEQIDEVLITVGGGGLISGVGSYLKTVDPNISISCCQPEHSMEMTLSLQKGEIVNQEDAKETISDGSAGGIEPNALTFDICRQVIDRCITVSEKEIKKALRVFVRSHGKIIEGSAAVAIAALMKEKRLFKGKNVVVIICGGNIEIDHLVKILSN